MVSRTGLWERLGGSARVTVVSAPPGSGKTVLLRSWSRAEAVESAPTLGLLAPSARSR